MVKPAYIILGHLYLKVLPKLGVEAVIKVQILLPFGGWVGGFRIGE